MHILHIIRQLAKLLALKLKVSIFLPQFSRQPNKQTTTKTDAHHPKITKTPLKRKKKKVKEVLRAETQAGLLNSQERFESHSNS